MNLRRFPTLACCFVGMEQEPNNHFLSTFVSFNCYSSCFSRWMTVRKFNCSCTGGPCALVLLLSSRIWISRRTFWSTVLSPSTLECSKLLLMPTSFMFNKRAGYCFLAKFVSELFPPCLNPYLPCQLSKRAYYSLYRPKIQCEIKGMRAASEINIEGSIPIHTFVLSFALG